LNAMQNGSIKGGLLAGCYPDVCEFENHILQS
jgi:hypothetical protein